MNPRFIQLHWHGVPALINLDHIIIIKDHGFIDSCGHEYEIDESYDEILSVIARFYAGAGQ